MHFSTNQNGELNAHNLQIEKAPSIEAASCADKTHIYRVLRMPPANPVVLTPKMWFLFKFSSYFSLSNVNAPGHVVNVHRELNHVKKIK